MKNGIFVLLIQFFINTNVSFGQSEHAILLSFLPVYNNSPLILEKNYYKLNHSDSIQFETLKFYVSNIQFLNNDSVVWIESQSYHLLDYSERKKMDFKVLVSSPIKFNKIKFYLGIDSLTNVSGAMGGDLDPTRGMYWTWQSGYINFKLEGNCSKCNSIKNEFTFHLGGYQYPNNALQTIIINTVDEKEIKISMDIKKFVEEIDLSFINHIMSPSSNAVLLSKNLSEIFKVEQ